MNPAFRVAADRLAPSVQPLIIETGDKAYPYCFGGTVFMLGYRGRAFVVTARHALDPDRLRPIWTYVNDTSRHRLPLRSVHYVPARFGMDDNTDLAVIDIDLDAALRSHAKKARIIDLDRSQIDWNQHRDTSQFLVIGFPQDHSAIDYDERTIATDRKFMYGRYGGPTETPYLHRLEIEPPPSLSSLSGFSGGPVMLWRDTLGCPSGFHVVGMAVQGSLASRSVRFVEISMLIAAIDQWYPR